MRLYVAVEAVRQLPVPDKRIQLNNFLLVLPLLRCPLFLLSFVVSLEFLIAFPDFLCVLCICV